MRNFSQVVLNTCFSSMTINGGEYQTSVEIQDVLSALAKAFEEDYKYVLGAYNLKRLDRATGGTGFDLGNGVSPSEGSVIDKLIDFQLFVDESLRTDGRNSRSSSFFYVNLNTGVAVSWIHCVG